MSDVRSVPVFLLLLFLSLGLVYSVATPLFEAPDEAWHYAYIRYLVEHRALPPLTGTDSGAYQEVAQPPLYYAVAALASGWVPDQDLTDLMWHNPGFGYQAGGTINDNKNMLIHTEREWFPWRGAVLGVRLARFVSLAFGLLTVIATWGLGREGFSQQPAWGLGVAAVVACTPQFLFISGVVSNDSAAAALSTAALWAIARVVNRGPTLRTSLATGVLIGLAALTKTSCLLLGPLAVIGQISAPRPRERKASRVLGHLSLVTVAAVAVGGWWYVRNVIMYRDPLALYVHLGTPWGRATPLSIRSLVAQLPRLYRSFWGAFGWGHVEFPSWLYLASGVTVAASLVGWSRALKRRRLPGSGQVFLLALAWWSLVFLALLQWMRQVWAPHGRLLFPAIGAWALLMVGGWTALPRPRLTSVFWVGLTVLSLLTPFLVIRPAFAPPRLMLPADAAATVQGVSLTYDGVARLLGVSLDQTSVSPGDVLPIRACWRALAPMSHDYTIFVQLVGGNNERVAERHTYPGLGRFPTSLWSVGQAFCDVYRVTVDDWASVPELYDLVIGLYDASTGDRLVARDPAGTVVGLPTLAQVRVVPEQPASTIPGHTLGYRVGEQIALIGYQVSKPIQSNSPLTVTLYWRADAPPTGDYRVFVHLLDESENGAVQLLVQHDCPPRYGRYPTLAWQAGDLIPDEHVLQVPALSAGSRVRLVAGMYRPDTLERLPVLGPSGRMPNDLIPLPLESP
jgi:4-amino-4-deoxy-L-arabinose transferase-like glycosyltransferase